MGYGLRLGSRVRGFGLGLHLALSSVLSVVGKVWKEVETPPKLCPQSFSFTLAGMKVDRFPPSGLQMALIREHLKE